MNAESVLESETPREPRLLSLRLSIMFFLQFAAMGIWVPVLGRVLSAAVEKGGLGFSELQIGLLMGVPATLAALSSPFVAGQLADRYIATERLMGAFAIASGALLWLAAGQTQFSVWMALLVVSYILRVPVATLSNSLSFAHLTDSKARFPRIRSWGTIGWIVGSWGFAMIWLQTDIHFAWLPPFYQGEQVPDVVARLLDAVRAGALLSICAGVYYFTLPHTPPKREGVDPLAFRKAVGLFQSRSFTVLLSAGLFVSAIHTIYFIQTSKFLPTLGLQDSYILPAMSTAQIAEILFMVFLGFFLKRLGFRWVLTIGVSAYAVRFGVFGLTDRVPLWVIVSSQGLHGVCFACYYAASFLYIDHLASTDIRASAQTLFGIVLGIGPVLGGLLSARLATWCTGSDGVLRYAPFWNAVAAIGLVATVFLAVTFRDETGEAQSTGAG
jgi:MFS family permease